MLSILPPFSESEVQKRRRDSMLNLSTYRDIMEGVTQSFEIVTAEMISAQMAKMNGSEDIIYAISDSTCQRSWDYSSGIHLQYSAGASLTSLREFFPILLGSWEEHAKCHVMFHDTSLAEGRKVPHLDLHDDDYWFAIRLTSFAICLGHANLLPRVAALWDCENDDMDGLLERLVAPYVPGRGTPPPTSAHAICLTSRRSRFSTRSRSNGRRSWPSTWTNGTRPAVGSLTMTLIPRDDSTTIWATGASKLPPSQWNSASTTARSETSRSIRPSWLTSVAASRLAKVQVLTMPKDSACVAKRACPARNPATGRPQQKLDRANIFKRAKSCRMSLRTMALPSGSGTATNRIRSSNA